jgi:hypothetical protein
MPKSNAPYPPDHAVHCGSGDVAVGHQGDR